MGYPHINPKEGDRYGHLTIKHEVERDKNNRRQFLCVCDCGNEKICCLMRLRNGELTTCGCKTWQKLDISEYINKKFNSLTIIEEIESIYYGKKKERMVKCICDCGNEVIKPLRSVISGHTKTCGDYSKRFSHNIYKDKDMVSVNKDGTKNRLYYIYRGILNRCYNSNNYEYHNYGGRGIIMHESWKNDYKMFREWALSNGYQDDLTIDRIDVNGNYEPSNCRWVTQQQQNNNMRRNRYFTYKGETHTIAEWSRITGIAYTTLSYRFQHWDPDKVFSGKCYIH